MIETRRLTARYGDVVAVDDVTLSIPNGEFLLLVGANGSGKTTLVRHFNALREPDEGRVFVNERDVAEDPVAARTSVGMVFQHPRDQFVASTVAADVAFGPENLGLDQDEIDRRVDDALEAVNLPDAGEATIASLSGGEQARVAVAGALAMEPDHLVLDEPLAGLDLAARRSVLDRLVSLHDADTSVIVVTHDLRDLVDVADRVVGLDEGAIAIDATPGDALDDLAGIGVRDPRC